MLVPKHKRVVCTRPVRLGAERAAALGGSGATLFGGAEAAGLVVGVLAAAGLELAVLAGRGAHQVLGARAGLLRCGLRADLGHPSGWAGPHRSVGRAGPRLLAGHDAWRLRGGRCISCSTCRGRVCSTGSSCSSLTVLLVCTLPWAGVGGAFFARALPTRRPPSVGVPWRRAGVVAGWIIFVGPGDGLVVTWEGGAGIGTTPPPPTAPCPTLAPQSFLFPRPHLLSAFGGT
jgi:hypothetical protein